MKTITCDKCTVIIPKEYLADIRLTKIISNPQIMMPQIELANPDLCESCLQLVIKFMYAKVPPKLPINDLNEK